MGAAMQHPTAPGPKMGYRIVGVATEEASTRPLPNTDIRISGGYLARTDHAGKYDVEVYSDGLFTVEAMREGYYPERREAHVNCQVVTLVTPGHLPVCMERLDIALRLVPSASLVGGPCTIEGRLISEITGELLEGLVTTVGARVVSASPRGQYRCAAFHEAFTPSRRA
jgi:hypothetical protein